MKLSTIGMLWMEGPLSYLEQLCVKSFVDAGHEVVLYHYGDVYNVPDGVEMDDAGQFLPRDGFLVHKRTGSPALHSDVFRYKMLKASRNMIWADTDAYCYRPFETPNGHFYGWESKTHINGGVLGLPHDSETLDALLEFTSDEFAIPSYYGPEYEQELINAKAAGVPVHASEQPWGVWGPHAITHFLHVTGDAKYALPQEGLYPFTFKDRRMMLKRNFDVTPYVTKNTKSIHFYGRRMRKRLVEKEGGEPHPKSLIGQLLNKHDIDPKLAPLPVAKPEPDQSVQPEQPALINLVDLVGQEAETQSSAALYQMLFVNNRAQIKNLLQITADKADVAKPSLQTWITYLPDAQLHALGRAKMSPVKHDRVSYQSCDMDTRDAFTPIVAKLPNLDVVIDTGSQASHHQQNAFIEMWSKLASGGIYIFEGLRWQPADLEPDNFTKTGDLFYRYQVDKVFKHADSDMQSAFEAIAPEISGCFVFQVDYNRNKRHQIAVLHKR